MSNDTRLDRIAQVDTTILALDLALQNIRFARVTGLQDLGPLLEDTEILLVRARNSMGPRG